MTRQMEYGEELVSAFLGGRAVASEGGADRATALVRAIDYTLRAIELEKAATWPQYPDFNKFGLEGYESSGEILQFEVESKAEVRDLLKKCGPLFLST